MSKCIFAVYLETRITAMLNKTDNTIPIAASSFTKLLSVNISTK